MANVNAKVTISTPAEQSRWRSKTAWLAAVSALLLVGDAFGLWPALGVTSDVARGIMDAILAVATGFGAFNNPTSKTSY
jgi:uncharacterized membrane protein